MHRRRFLCCTAAIGAGLFTSLATPAANGQTLREGFVNPCRLGLPAELAQHELVRSAFEGIDLSRLVDVHAHLLGTGDSGSGCTVHADMQRLWRPTELLRRAAILNAACVAGDAPSIDRAYVERLRQLIEAFPAGARWWLYAFDHALDDRGAERPEWTTFHVPNEYAARIASEHPGRLQWVASVHPYREDAVERLDAARQAGAVACKWLPSAMNIALDDQRCRRVYDRLAGWKMPLIVHCGEERAVPGAGRDELGNPLLVRHPLRHGVRVVMAHAASLGSAADTDSGSRRRVPAFDLFERLMGESDAPGRLLGDLSALFQANRRPEVWQAVLRHEQWHERLLHGSDYPLPGLMPLFDLRALVRAGLLDAAAVPVLRRIREHNALLFDFVLKRQLRLGSVALPAAVFEGRALATTDATNATGPGSPRPATVPAARSSLRQDKTIS